MAAAVNTIANGGVRVVAEPDPGHGRPPTTAVVVGTDHTTTHRVVSAKAAHQIDADDGAGGRPRRRRRAAGRRSPGYRVAGKTGTAQRVGADVRLLRRHVHGLLRRLRPADDPRFTVYVVVQNPAQRRRRRLGRRPGVPKIMSYALRRYGVPPTGATPSHLPVDVVSPGRPVPTPRRRDGTSARVRSTTAPARRAAPTRRHRRSPSSRPARRRPRATSRRPRRAAVTGRHARARSGCCPATCTPPCPAPAPTARLRRRPRSRPARSPCSPTRRADAAVGRAACPLLVVDRSRGRARPARRPRLRRPGRARCG